MEDLNGLNGGSESSSGRESFSGREGEGDRSVRGVERSDDEELKKEPPVDKGVSGSGEERYVLNGSSREYSGSSIFGLLCIFSSASKPFEMDPLFDMVRSRFRTGR